MTHNSRSPQRTNGDTTSQQRIRATVSSRRQAPMIRSTTRVIWTMSRGTVVDYSDPR